MLLFGLQQIIIKKATIIRQVLCKKSIKDNKLILGLFFGSVWFLNVIVVVETFPHMHATNEKLLPYAWTYRRNSRLRCESRSWYNVPVHAKTKSTDLNLKKNKNTHTPHNCARKILYSNSKLVFLLVYIYCTYSRILYCINRLPLKHVS